MELSQAQGKFERAGGLVRVSVPKIQASLMLVQRSVLDEVGSENKGQTCHLVVAKMVTWNSCIDETSGFVRQRQEQLCSLLLANPWFEHGWHGTGSCVIMSMIATLGVASRQQHVRSTLII